MSELYARGKVIEKRLQLSRLRGMVDAAPGRHDGAPLRIPQAIRENDRVSLLLLKRLHGADNERARRTFVEGEELIDLVPRIGVVARRCGRDEDVRSRPAVREEQIAMLRERIVGEVLRGIREHVGKMSALDVDRPDRPVVDLDQVHAVVRRVAVVLAREQVADVDVGIERNGDRRIRAEPVELVEEHAGALLELARNGERRVQPQPRRAPGIGARRDVVREGNLRERLTREIEHDAWSAGLAGGSEPLDGVSRATCGDD